MGQKVNPIANRLGYIRGWESLWYAKDASDYADRVIEDQKIRDYVHKRFPRGAFAYIIIERTRKRLHIYLHSARVGVVLGKKGAEIDKLTQELKKLTKTEKLDIDVIEVKNPYTSAKLIAENIAQQLEACVAHRRAMKMAINAAMRTPGVHGIKVRCSGRLGGSEMARTDEYKDGRVPLHTFRADVDFYIAEAKTIYGVIGVKVWLFKGEVIGRRELDLNLGARKASGGGRRRQRRR